MKISLKIDDQQQNQNPIHLRAKIPITVFGLPFLSAFSAVHHHHPTAAASSDKLSLSLRTHFSSGPSLKLSYNTPSTTTTASAAAAAAAPLTLSLKSGVSLSGSPNNSPLIISANFSFSPQNPNPNPHFSIQFKPRLGSFSLRKSVSSNPVPSPSKNLNGGGADGSENSYGFVPLERPINWKEFTMESPTKDSILSGILVMADTELPVTKRIKMNLRWGVSVPSDFDKNLPYLRVNKIKFERVDEIKEENLVEKKGDEGNNGDFEMLKGMYSWMSRELSDLQKENREIRQTMEELKSSPSMKSSHGYGGGGGGGGGKRWAPVVENSGGFEQWRVKKTSGGNGEDNVQKEMKKNVSSMSDMESELQRAIKAASS